MAELQSERGSGGEEFLGVDDGPFGVELGLLVAEDFLAVDAVNDFLVAMDFHFDFDPLVGGDVPGRGFNDVLGDELAVDFKIGAGGANVAGGALALAFVREELEFDADRESLFEGHTLRGLGVNHDAAVEVHIAGGVGHHLAGEFVFHPEDVVGIREVGVEVAEAFVEGGILVVFALQDAFFDAEGVEGVFTNGMACDFRSPACEVFSVEERNPLGTVEGEEEQRENTKNHRAMLPIAADFGELLG